MIGIFCWLQSLLFILLALIHINWGFGGSWGFDQAIPTTSSGERVLNPTKRDSLIVGFGLLFFAIFYLLKLGVIEMDVPSWVMIIAGWLIPAVFLLRAMGDFKFIGFSKKLKSTEFGQMDTKYYSPLCLFLAVNGIILQLSL